MQTLNEPDTQIRQEEPAGQEGQIDEQRDAQAVGIEELRIELDRLEKAVIETKTALEEAMKKEKEETEKLELAKKEKIAAKKAEEEKNLQNFFDAGKGFAAATFKDWYLTHPIKILDFNSECQGIRGYLNFLRDSFDQLKIQFEDRKKTIFDPKREIKPKRIPKIFPPDRSFPASGSVIFGCCAGLNGTHNLHCPRLADNETLEKEAKKALEDKQAAELKELTDEFTYKKAAFYRHIEGFLGHVIKFEELNKRTTDGRYSDYKDALFTVVRIAFTGDDI